MHATSPPSAVAALALALLCGPAPAAVLPYPDTGSLYVSMWDADEIAVFGEGGEPLGRFSADGLDGPRGLAFHPERDELWVAAELGDALQVFDGEHRPLRTVELPDFDGPVGIAFSPSAAPDGSYEIHVGNSDADEILVLAEDGRRLRRYTDPSLRDPGCVAFLADGTLFVANRLGGSAESGGAVARFGASERFEFDFAAEGLASTMGVARDPNVAADALDDTLWVTSGGGRRGVHEFDRSGNLLRTVLPADVPGGEAMVPQGIAFADDGRFVVVSSENSVYEFDGDGGFLSRFPTGPGTSRSVAFRRCDAGCPTPADADPSSPSPSGSNEEPVVPEVGDDSGGGSSGDSGGGGGALALGALAALALTGRVRRGPRTPVRGGRRRLADLSEAAHRSRHVTGRTRRHRASATVARRPRDRSG